MQAFFQGSDLAALAVEPNATSSSE